MTSLLCRLFVKDRENLRSSAVRHAYGSMASGVGIVANLLLSAAKLVAGVLSGAISVTADGLNNLSDAGSQVISLLSFKISAKPADRDHPFGHARIEYVASMIVSFLVLLVGFELLKESARQVFYPTETDFSWIVLVILAVSVAVKLWLFFFYRSIGKRIESSVMRATAVDCLSDAASTGAVLVSGIVAHMTDLRTDAYMGILVAILILVAGIRILNDTKNSILGSAPDPKEIEEIVALTAEYPQILGIHDMVVHHYGAGNVIASFHAEVDGAADVFITHDVIDTVERRLWSELGIRATVHMDPIVTDDERVQALRMAVAERVKGLDDRLSIHDFRFVEGQTHSNLIFDVSAPFELKQTDDALKRKISSAISELSPNYFAVITIDRQ
ncbi:MAG: cation transporter [Ruminococcaceae bacterium]|nr:cation transporter [Oscillospiraceae bacterium]